MLVLHLQVCLVQRVVWISHRAGGFHVEHAGLLAGERLLILHVSGASIGECAHAVDGVPCLAVARAGLLHILLASARWNACMHGMDSNISHPADNQCCWQDCSGCCMKRRIRTVS